MVGLTCREQEMVHWERCLVWLLFPIMDPWEWYIYLHLVDFYGMFTYI